MNNRRKTEISLGLRMSSEDLENALSDKPRPGNLSRRKYLVGILSRMENLRLELNESGRLNEDIGVIRDLVRKKIFGLSVSEEEGSKFNFVWWYNAFADSHDNAESRTRAAYLHTLSRLRDYCKETGDDLDRMDFADVSVSWLEGFDRFMAKTMRLNSRNHHMRNIRAVFKYAIRNDVDIRNPFDRMRLRVEETRKRSMSVEDLRRLFDYPVEPYAEIYRDMFKLCFMLIGINPVDLFRLEGIDSGGRITYRRAKTHKLYSVKVEPEALAIIERYRGRNRLLNLSERWKSHEEFGKAANRALKVIGAERPAPGRSKKGEACFSELTLYWARHTWATIAAEIDVPDAVISQALGHSGGTIATTAVYIRRNEKKVDEANRRVLDWVLYGQGRDVMSHVDVQFRSMARFKAEASRKGSEWIKGKVF